VTGIRDGLLSGGRREKLGSDGKVAKVSLAAGVVPGLVFIVIAGPALVLVSPWRSAGRLVGGILVFLALGLLANVFNNDHDVR
jgi:hypothetical protein